MACRAEQPLRGVRPSLRQEPRRFVAKIAGAQQGAPATRESDAGLKTALLLKEQYAECEKRARADPRRPGGLPYIALKQKLESYLHLAAGLVSVNRALGAERTARRTLIESLTEVGIRNACIRVAKVQLVRCIVSGHL